MVTEEEWELVRARMEAFPENLKMVIIGVGSLSKDQMLYHIDQKDEIGERIAAIQLNYLKKMKVR